MLNIKWCYRLSLLKVKFHNSSPHPIWLRGIRDLKSWKSLLFHYYNLFSITKFTIRIQEEDISRKNEPKNVLRLYVLIIHKNAKIGKRIDKIVRKIFFHQKKKYRGIFVFFFFYFWSFNITAVESAKLSFQCDNSSPYYNLRSSLYPILFAHHPGLPNSNSTKRLKTALRTNRSLVKSEYTNK